MQKLLKGCALLFIVFIASITFAMIRNKVMFSKIDKEVNGMANILGYGEENLVDEYNSCYDIFAHCYKFMIFKTNYDYEGFEILMRNVDLFNNAGSFDISGYEIFTKINLRGKNSITINGLDGLGDRNQLPRIRANRWSVAIPNSVNNFINIDYYDLANVDNIELSGVGLKQNLVVIQYQYK